MGHTKKKILKKEKNLTWRLPFVLTHDSAHHDFFKCPPKLLNEQTNRSYQMFFTQNGLLK